MSTLRRLRNFWIPWVTTIVLACCSDALAQTSYKVTDLGVLPNDNMGCAMASIITAGRWNRMRSWTPRSRVYL